VKLHRYSLEVKGFCSSKDLWISQKAWPMHKNGTLSGTIYRYSYLVKK
jgi:hypothetical protein